MEREAWLAERGSGTTMNGEQVRIAVRARTAGTLRGSVRTRFLDEQHRVFAEAAVPSLGENMPAGGCAYPDVITGLLDFVLFRRTLPWDHAPGSLILQEAGGVARRWDGTDYLPGDQREGLIAASDEITWESAAATLLQPRHRSGAKAAKT